jgi:hypothetical protein
LNDEKEVVDAFVDCVFWLNDVSPHTINDEVLDDAYQDALASGFEGVHVGQESRHLGTLDHLVLSEVGEECSFVESVNI